MKESNVMGINQYTKTPEISKTIKDYWICEKDGRKWIRSAVLMKQTSKPYKAKPLNERIAEALKRFMGL